MRAVERFLAAIHRHPRWGWAGLIVYAALVTFPHEQVQLLIGKISFYTGLKLIYQTSAAVTVTLGIVFTLVVIRRTAGRPERRVVLGYWLLTLALIGGTWRLLTANNTELVHYPQYVPEGLALVALTLSPVESIAWVTILGGLDEGNQYAFLTTGRAVPFDFNDIYMDLLGGTIGVLLGVALLPGDGRGQTWKGTWTGILKRPGVAAVLSIVGAGVVLWALGLMRLHDDKINPHYWFSLSHSDPSMPWLLNRAWSTHKFHELVPVEGPILILATLAIYAALDRRVRVSIEPPKR
ncbi:MAG TPA: hypothetical protein VKR43_12235 [Bryobacteraceae bacterium]|nr:hypothetical protein [Bryobacteraceae bacterium]